MKKEQVIAIIAEHLEIDPSEITEESTFADLDIDSLTAGELMMEFEDALDGVELDAKEAGTSVKELIAYLETKG